MAADDERREQDRRDRARGKRAARPADTHVASALRSAYEEAVREDVPPEFIDLLGKLS